MGKASEFVAVTMMDTTLDGLPGTFSNAKIIFKPFFSKAVMGGKPSKQIHIRRCLSSDAVLRELYASRREEFLTGSFATHPVAFILHLS